MKRDIPALKVRKGDTILFCGARYKVKRITGPDILGNIVFETVRSIKRGWFITTLSADYHIVRHMDEVLLVQR